MSLWEEFQDLPPPSDSGETSFSAAPLQNRLADFIGKTIRGTPAFLLRVDSSDLQRLPILLKHLRVSFDISCKVTLDDRRVIAENFCILECTSDLKPLQLSFVAAVGSVIESLAEAPSRKEVLDCIHSIVEAFRMIEMPSPSTVRGLWGELLILDLAVNPLDLVKCWREEISDRYDFAADNYRMEVKTTTGSVRSHEFSLEQVRADSGTYVCIASVELESSPAGATALDLANRIHERMAESPDAVGRLWAKVFQTLASDDPGSASAKFDADHARKTLLLIEANSIPCPLIPVGAPISNVRFSISLAPLLQALKFDGPGCAYWAQRLAK